MMLMQLFMSAMMILVKQLGKTLPHPKRSHIMTFYTRRLLLIMTTCSAVGRVASTAQMPALCAGKWNISVFIVLLIRSSTVLLCALMNLARDGTNPLGNRCSTPKRRSAMCLRGDVATNEP